MDDDRGGQRRCGSSPETGADRAQASCPRQSDRPQPDPIDRGEGLESHRDQGVCRDPEGYGSERHHQGDQGPRDRRRLRPASRFLWKKRSPGLGSSGRSGSGAEGAVAFMPVDRRVRAALVATALTLLVAIFSVDYTVRQGDTLGEIARDNDVSLSDLVVANNLSNPDLIRPGQVLVIPTKHRLHMVARGDSVYRIAAAYGTTVATLIKTNNLANPNLIYPGEQLVVP